MSMNDGMGMRRIASIDNELKRAFLFIRRRNSKEDNPFDFNNKSTTGSSVKDEILEIQRQQQESQEPKRDDFHFVEPRSVSLLSNFVRT
jgi:hypothetical protein